MTVVPVIKPRIVRALVGVSGAVGLLFEKEYMKGSVKLVKGSKPNEGTISIHNLSDATIAQLEAPNQVLQIQAGEGVAGQIFLGSIVRRGVVTKSTTNTRVTTIKARDGRRVWRDTRASKAYPPNTPVATVVTDLLALAVAQGLSLYPGNQYPADSFPAGWACAGLWRQALTEILAPRGYYWTIQGRVIYVLTEAGTIPGNVPLLTPATGLIGSPVRTDKGCNLESDLNPGIRPGWGVQVVSRLFNGLYRPTKVTHSFDSDGLIWKTAAQCEVIK